MMNLHAGPTFPLCLAPMVGLSHVGLRRLIRHYMPANADTLWPTEMLNSRKIPNENLSRTPETLKAANETDLVPQILGNEEKPISESVKILVQSWGAIGIDINMGCPVQKALKHNYGVALMGDVDYAAKVVEITKKNSTVPVSVKLRAVGQTESKDQSIEQLIYFTGRLVEAGADWITLHPRTAEQQRKGKADWSQIAELKKNLKVPVWGNGDIQTCDDVFKMISETSVDKVMSGRALAARPWMVWQVGHRLGFHNPLALQNEVVPITAEDEGREYGRALSLFIDFCEEEFMQKAQVSEAIVLRKILFYIKTTHVWLEFGHTLLSLSTRAKNLNELRQLSSVFFQSEQRMFEKTELRQ